MPNSLCPLFTLHHWLYHTPLHFGSSHFPILVGAPPLLQHPSLEAESAFSFTVPISIHCFSNQTCPWTGMPYEMRIQLHIPYLRCFSDSPFLTSQGPDSFVKYPWLSALAPTHLSVFAPTLSPGHPPSAPAIHCLLFLNQCDSHLCLLSYLSFDFLSSFMWVMNTCLFFCPGSGPAPLFNEPFLGPTGFNETRAPPQPRPLSPASAAR